MLTVKSQPQNGHVVVSISDTGVGLTRKSPQTDNHATNFGPTF